MKTVMSSVVLCAVLASAVVGNAAASQVNGGGTDADMLVAGAIGSASTLLVGGSKVVVASWTVTTPAAGIAGWLGVTTSTVTVLALPVAGILTVAGLAVYGGYTAYNHMVSTGK